MRVLIPSLTVALVSFTACENKDGGFTQYNTPPNASITSPPDGSATSEGEVIAFRGIIKDDQDSPEALSVQWSSDLDGVLVDGVTDTSIAADASGQVNWSTANLSAGNHVITLTTLDSDGESAQDTITLSVSDVPDAPEIAVIHPIANEYGIEGELFEFKVEVFDGADAPEDLYVVMDSDLDGVFCEPIPDEVGITVCEAELSVGDHTLTFEVIDTEDFSASTSAYFPVVSADGIDNDGDGFNEVQGDCDDSDPDINPIAEETLNKEDDDCDAKIDEGTDYYDDDGDGFAESEGDCDDNNANIHPDAVESCDTFDQDCDDIVDEETLCYDDDGDGYTETASDCDDDDPTSYPGGGEFDDGADNDCDGRIDEGTDGYDDDGDGFTEREGDCDDDEYDVNPDAEETCNGYDDDCNGDSDEEGADGCTQYYPDMDNDTYGDERDSGACLCGATPAYDVTNDNDCYDGNQQANPSQTSYFDGYRGDSSYDYNCDGLESPLYAEEYSCTYAVSGFSLDCIETEGWASSVASCGATASWARGCEFSIEVTDLLLIVLGGGDLDGLDFCTYETTVPETQECR